MDIITEGWPNREESEICTPTILGIQGCRDEMSIEDGLVLKRQRIVILQSMQVDMLARVQEGHQGIAKSNGMPKVAYIGITSIMI